MLIRQSQCSCHILHIKILAKDALTYHLEPIHSIYICSHE
uniref:Uncharacterized protein n=1 Tax=Arundo donax TaxID=35708 RepID=A0A0A9CB66_ARUDO